MYFFKKSDKCPYKNICENYTEDSSCIKLCSKINKIDYYFQQANIPFKYRTPMKLYPSSEDVDVYDILVQIKENVLEAVEEGYNLTIQSSIRNNGKTSWAIKILQQYIHLVWDIKTNNLPCLYVDVPQYLASLKEDMNNKDGESKQFSNDINSSDIVVFDNLDEEKLSEWAINTLRLHIRRRVENGLANIYILGKPTQTTRFNIGEDLAYYVLTNSNVLNLYGNRGDKK